MVKLDGITEVTVASKAMHIKHILLLTKMHSFEQRNLVIAFYIKWNAIPN